jgi:hypothetical protein
VLFQFFVFSSCLKPIFRANGHEKRGFEWSTFSLKLKCFYSKVGGYTPEYVVFTIRFKPASPTPTPDHPPLNINTVEVVIYLE